MKAKMDGSSKTKLVEDSPEILALDKPGRTSYKAAFINCQAICPLLFD